MVTFAVWLIFGDVLSGCQAGFTGCPCRASSPVVANRQCRVRRGHMRERYCAVLGASKEKLCSVEELIKRLSSQEIRGASFGGPYVGVGHNEITQKIVRRGSGAIKPLINRLEVTENVNQAIFIVFCLRELKARSAKSAIERLKKALDEGKRFAFQRRDLTLEMQVVFFLRDLNSWQPGNAAGVELVGGHAFAAGGGWSLFLQLPPRKHGTRRGQKA